MQAFSEYNCADIYVPTETFTHPVSAPPPPAQKSMALLSVRFKTLIAHSRVYYINITECFLTYGMSQAQTGVCVATLLIRRSVTPLAAHDALVGSWQPNVSPSRSTD